MKKIFLTNFLLVLLLLLFPFQIQAICEEFIGEESLVPCGTESTPMCNFCHIFQLLNNILGLILTCFAPVMVGFMLVVGGLYILVAGPKPEMLNTGKAIITGAIIGLVIVFASWVFLNGFLDAMGIAEWTGLGTWWKIDCN